MIKEITTRKEYTTVMARAEEIVAKADSIGGFGKLSKEELEEFANKQQLLNNMK